MSTRLFVSGLAQATTDRDLHDAFAPHGVVQDARVMTYRDRGRGSRGFGYVTMANEAEALAAIEALNGGFLAGRTIKVERAKKSTR